MPGLRIPGPEQVDNPAGYSPSVNPSGVKLLKFGVFVLLFVGSTQFILRLAAVSLIFAVVAFLEKIMIND